MAEPTNEAAGPSRSRNHSSSESTDIEDLMEETFDIRRQDVLVNNLGVKNLLVIYPGLRDFQELRREFERITGKSVKTFECHLDCMLKQYAESQLVKDNYSCTRSFCKESFEILRHDHNEDDGARITAARMIIYACAQSEKTWWDVIFKVIGENDKKRSGRLQPTVIVKGSPFDDKCADVYCEKTRIVKRINFHEAILTCYYLFYVFNISLPPVDREVYNAFEEILSLMRPREEKEGTADATDD